MILVVEVDGNLSFCVVCVNYKVLNFYFVFFCLKKFIYLNFCDDYWIGFEGWNVICWEIVM